jgi:hypothetical protein
MRKGNGVASTAPWNDQVAHLMSREGMSRDKARDRVILDFLQRGDASALAALLMDGHVPAPNVRFILALMLLDNDEAEAAMARHQMDPDPWWVPHRLIIKGRPTQPRRLRAAETARERGPQRAAGPLMPELGYEAAIARLDQAVLATDAAAGIAAGGKTAGGKTAGGKAAGGRNAGKAASQPRPAGKRKK